MIIEDLLTESWSIEAPRQLTQQTIVELINNFKMKLQDQITRLPAGYRGAFMKDYLHLLGFEDLVIQEETDNPVILIKYQIAGGIELTGAATTHDKVVFDQSIIDSRLQADFYYIFNFDQQVGKSNTESNPKAAQFFQENYIDVLLTILIVRFFRNYEPELRRNTALLAWFFEYLMKELDISSMGFKNTEERWNKLFNPKIAWRDW